MKSYASVEEIGQEFIKCELELIPVEESNVGDFATKPTDMVYIPVEIAAANIAEIYEGDILEVEHVGNGTVSSVICKNDIEKSRRVELARQLKI